MDYWSMKPSSVHYKKEGHSMKLRETHSKPHTVYECVLVWTKTRISLLQMEAAGWYQPTTHGSTTKKYKQCTCNIVARSRDHNCRGKEIRNSLHYPAFKSYFPKPYFTVIFGLSCSTIFPHVTSQTGPGVEISTRNLPGGKGGRCVEMTILPPSCADNIRILGASASCSPRCLSKRVQG
jgi:hypothetical protein